MSYENARGKSTIQQPFEGIVSNLERRYRETQSDGMRREIGKAKQKNMTIRYFTEDMEETECR